MNVHQARMLHTYTGTPHQYVRGTENTVIALSERFVPTRQTEGGGLRRNQWFTFTL